MAGYTRYLTAIATNPTEFIVGVTGSSPTEIFQDALKQAADLRYSPILPAYLSPDEGPPDVPAAIDSISFLFASSPYKLLGALKPILEPSELPNVYFTQGLASIILLNSARDRAFGLATTTGNCGAEFWKLNEGRILAHDVEIRCHNAQSYQGPIISLPTGTEPEVAIYIEQIAASLTSLWSAYGTYFPAERNTLCQLANFTNSLIKQYKTVDVKSCATKDSFIRQEKANSIVSALVELSSALSYAVTQGTSGSMPILANRSPFPHHSLLGIGGSVRALTKFTRYLETAFITRSATDVIRGQYTHLKHEVPAQISLYNSGPEYRLQQPGLVVAEMFDQGGHFPQTDNMPLIAHFSLRHGFMESKFSVTAASEALTAEIQPPWTLMTLSHEIMHSRVRAIFQALFGMKWQDDEMNVIREEHYAAFIKWLGANRVPNDTPVDSGLRSAILNFCCAMEQLDILRQTCHSSPAEYSLDRLNECYSNHKQLAIEVMVHFHDYYFAYACQPKMYLMSLWASWIKVAAPFTRPDEYLARSLAIVACGTGLEPRAAFNYAVEKLTEALDSLEASGVQSALFERLRYLVASNELTAGNYATVEFTRVFFKTVYYLADQIRLCFASPLIASQIDRIEVDPFAEGSTEVSDYTSSIYVYGEEGNPIVSPIRYSLATLFRVLSDECEIDDPQWLTAWNFMVISSQEMK